jgi:medium-chain acyl-[acyl-carrier-protein] hydrolase
MLPVWKEEITIRSFDVDFRNQLRISSLCSYFQEVAGRHADHMEVGFDHLRQSGLAWVLSRLEISVLVLPEWGDTITIETWPTGNERLYYRREFTVTRGNGERLVSAVSYWLLINIQNRRPKMLPLPAELTEHNANRYALKAMTGDIPSPSATFAETSLVQVKYGDLDVNLHVNNARYVAWIDDLFPVAFHSRHFLEYLRIDIRQEVKADELVKIVKSGTTLEFIVEGMNNDNQKTCFRAILRFGEGKSISAASPAQ